MASKPYSLVRVADFQGLHDDLAVEAGDQQASVLTNWYKDRRKLVRRKGQLFVATAQLTNLAADFTLSGGSFETNGLRIANGLNTLFQGQDLTVAGWFLLDSVTTNATVAAVSNGLSLVNIFNLGSSAGQSWRLSVNITTPRFEFFAHNSGGAGTTVTASSVTVATGQWYFVAARHDAAADVIAIQVNGGTLHTAAHTFGLDEPTGTDFRFGSAYNGSTSQGQNCIDGGAALGGIWRTAQGGGGALSDANLLALYNGGVPLRYAGLSTALKTGLVAWWDMDETNVTRDDDHNASTTFDLLQYGTVGSRTGPP